MTKKEMIAAIHAAGDSIYEANQELKIQALKQVLLSLKDAYKAVRSIADEEFDGMEEDTGDIPIVPPTPTIRFREFT